MLQVDRNAYADGIYIRDVSGEGLPAHPVSDVPQFGRSVAGAGHERL